MRRVEGGAKEEGKGERKEAADCHIVVWKGSVASGSVTTATTASVVTAVR